MRANDTYGAEIARATAYKLLAECYYAPTERLRQDVKRLACSLQAMGSPAYEAVDRMDAAVLGGESLEELAIDYSRLFVGPFALLAPPFGSIYLEQERRLMADSTQAVERYYREAGLELAEGFNGTPDHIAAELEFLYLLIWRETAARRSGDADALAAATALRRRFLTEHLGAWVGPFAAAVTEGAQTAHYRELAALTDRFVALEASRGDDA